MFRLKLAQLGSWVFVGPDDMPMHYQAYDKLDKLNGIGFDVSTRQKALAISVLMTDHSLYTILHSDITDEQYAHVYDAIIHPTNLRLQPKTQVQPQPAGPKIPKDFNPPYEDYNPEEIKTLLDKTPAKTRNNINNLLNPKASRIVSMRSIIAQEDGDVPVSAPASREQVSQLFGLLDELSFPVGDFGTMANVLGILASGPSKTAPIAKWALQLMRGMSDDEYKSLAFNDAVRVDVTKQVAPTPAAPKLMAPKPVAPKQPEKQEEPSKFKLKKQKLEMKQELLASYADYEEFDGYVKLGQPTGLTVYPLQGNIKVPAKGGMFIYNMKTHQEGMVIGVEPGSAETERGARLYVIVVPGRELDAWETEAYNRKPPYQVILQESRDGQPKIAQLTYDQNGTQVTTGDMVKTETGALAPILEVTNQGVIYQDAMGQKMVKKPGDQFEVIKQDSSNQDQTPDGDASSGAGGPDMLS